jgi:hypothetical protein
MKYTDKVFKWMDGTDTNFTNWANDAVRDGTAQCVQMSLVDKTIGKWLDESCKRTALIVCQKQQELNFNLLAESIQKMEKTIEIVKNKTDIQEKELSSIKASVIPLGFLYTQFPNQSKPEDLWPNTKWSEITSQYSGLFFRAEGAGSEPFGKIQLANQSIISDSHLQGVHYYPEDKPVEMKSTTLIKEHWTNIDTGNYLILGILQLFTTGGEVRPKNTAIKIWKRIQ